VGFRWETAPEDADLLRARVAFERGRNVLRVEQDPVFGERAAAWVGKAAASAGAGIVAGAALLSLKVAAG
jgi:hypothetical protein